MLICEIWQFISTIHVLMMKYSKHARNELNNHWCICSFQVPDFPKKSPPPGCLSTGYRLSLPSLLKGIASTAPVLPFSTSPCRTWALSPAPAHQTPLLSRPARFRLPTRGSLHRAWSLWSPSHLPEPPYTGSPSPSSAYHRYSCCSYETTWKESKA